MAFFDPARSQDFLFISGTKVKSDSTFHYSYFVTKRDRGFVVDAWLGEEEREPTRRFHVSLWLESVG